MKLFARIMLVLTALLSFPSWAHEATPSELQGVGIEEHLGKKIPLDLQFLNEQGEKVSLHAFVDGIHPTVFTLTYYECPNLCTLLLNAVTSTLKQLPWTPGKEFQLVNVSIDPRDTPDLAKQKKAAYLKELGKPDAEKGWHFLTGRDENIHALADAFGFHYRYDKDQKQFAHTAVLMIVTPEGVISRYLYGITYPPRDFKLALLEAGKGKIGNIVDKFLLYCYHYDPKGKKYALIATRLMKVAGLFTIVGIFVLLLKLRRRKA